MRSFLNKNLLLILGVLFFLGQACIDLLRGDGDGLVVKYGIYIWGVIFLAFGLLHTMLEWALKISIPKIQYVFAATLFLIAGEMIFRIGHPELSVFVTNSGLSPFENRTILNEEIKGVDRVIRTETNSTGMKGEDLPESSDKRKRILFLGSSTTACNLLGKNNDWPLLTAKVLKEKGVNVWANNGAVDGQNVNGSLQVLQELETVIEPDAVVIMPGLCDAFSGNSAVGGKMDAGRKDYWFYRNSRFYRYYYNLLHSFSRESRGVIQHGGFDFDKPKYIARNFVDSKDPQILSDRLTSIYRTNLSNLIEYCKAKGIKIVLISQPIWTDAHSDEFRKIVGDSLFLEKLKISGREYAKIINKYNSITKEISVEHKILFLDLNAEIRKSTEFYYDLEHFNKSGAKTAALIVGEYLQKNLN